jgi:hypothetical protein
LFVFNQFGDLERCALRPGNVHSADGWRGMLEPVLARYRHTMQRCYFRGDAAFANPEVYECLEAEGYKYTIRLPVNSVLQERIGWLLTRPIGARPKHWSLTTLRQRLVKIGAKIVCHGRSVIFQIAELAVPHDMFQNILTAIPALRPLPSARC